MAVFAGDSPTRWRSKERVDHRERIEGKLVEIGMRAALLGLDVVFDFGLWSRDERSALRWIADSRGIRAEASSTCRSSTRSSAAASPTGTTAHPASSR